MYIQLGLSSGLSDLTKPTRSVQPEAQREDPKSMVGRIRIFLVNKNRRFGSDNGLKDKKLFLEKKYIFNPHQFLLLGKVIRLLVAWR